MQLTTFYFNLDFASHSYKILPVTAQPGKLVLLLCNTQVTNKKGSLIIFMQLEEIQNSGQGNYVFTAENIADMILSSVPKLTRNGPEAHSSKMLFH